MHNGLNFSTQYLPGDLLRSDDLDMMGRSVQIRTMRAETPTGTGTAYLVGIARPGMEWTNLIITPNRQDAVDHVHKTLSCWNDSYWVDVDEAVKAARGSDLRKLREVIMGRNEADRVEFAHMVQTLHARAYANMCDELDDLLVTL